MELKAYTEADSWLTQALECDPLVMAELGGPHPKEKITEIHRKRLACIADGDWWFKIIPAGSDAPVGAIGIWKFEWQGASVHEIGWMLLPAYQRRGIASAAAKMIIARALAEKRFQQLHAFPGVSNIPSNAICEKMGFSKLGTTDVTYTRTHLEMQPLEIGCMRPTRQLSRIGS